MRATKGQFADPAGPVVAYIKPHAHVLPCPTSARLPRSPYSLPRHPNLPPCNSCSLQALKDREEAVRNGKLTTIVFIRDKNSKGQVRGGVVRRGWIGTLEW